MLVMGTHRANLVPHRFFLDRPISIFVVYSHVLLYDGNNYLFEYMAKEEQ